MYFYVPSNNLSMIYTIFMLNIPLDEDADDKLQWVKIISIRIIIII